MSKTQVTQDNPQVTKRHGKSPFERFRVSVRRNPPTPSTVCGAVFFPVQDSEERHAAHCKRRPYRRLGNENEVRHEEVVARQREPGGGARRAIHYEFSG